MAKLSCKKIIENMIEAHVRQYVWENAEGFADIDGIELQADSDLIHFTLTAKVDYRKYIIRGAVDAEGYPFISMIEYHGMRCTERDAKGEWIDESAKPFTKLVYGDALKTFKFMFGE